MRVLVVGSGGREHALVWKLAQECEVHAAPGNPGVATLAECHTGEPLEVARRVRPDLVVIGPENPLIEGLADTLREAGFPTFGPGSDGAKLEASKAFSKEQMLLAGVPTADSGIFKEPAAAKEFTRARFGAGKHVAVKASGAALGKGVVVATSLEEAEDAIDMMMVDREFGDAGATLVIEDRLVGREFSLITVCSGTRYVSLPVVQDFKRALDGDRGPNTGGMGTYGPVPWVGQDLVRQTEVDVVEPMLASLAAQGIDYRGVLFSGLMLVDGTPFCLEYNVRFGDPETQSIVRRIGSGFAGLLKAASLGDDLKAPAVLDNAVVSVVLASGGYPGAYAKGKPIEIPKLEPEIVVFHAGTALKDGRLVTAGGRVLAVSATADTVSAARKAAYDAAQHIEFEGKFCRSDIAADA